MAHDRRPATSVHQRRHRRVEVNPLLDVHLARSLADLLTDSLGDLLGWLCLAALAVSPVAAVLLNVLAELHADDGGLLPTADGSQDSS